MPTRLPCCFRVFYEYPSWQIGGSPFVPQVPGYLKTPYHQHHQFNWSFLFIRMNYGKCHKKCLHLMKSLSCISHLPVWVSEDIRNLLSLVCIRGYQDLPKRTGTDRNGPTKIPKRTSMGTEMDRKGLQWVPKRTGTDFSSDRNEHKWEPEKVGWGTIGTILIKLCMYG